MTTSTDHQPHEEREEHDLGLAHDLPRIVERNLGRRGLLALLGGVGAVAVAGCAADAGGTSVSTGSRGRPDGPPEGGPPDGGPGGSTVEVGEGEIPEETAGPYPGDGSNGPDVLAESGVVRSDIRSSFGSASGTAAGVPLTLRMRVLDLEGEDVTVLAGAAVYAWHCDAEGRYSMYDDEVVDENYLRGVQVADDDGWLSFTTVFPGCYAGRWPHVHFEVYRSVEDATGDGEKLRTSQLAFPAETCETVYARDGYGDSAANLDGVSLETDGIFSDGYRLQLATMSGDADAGYTATLRVPV